MAPSPRDPTKNAEPVTDAGGETEPIIKGELLNDDDRYEKTSHMTRSDLEPLLALFEAAKAEAAAAAALELEDTQEMPAELVRSLQAAIHVPQQATKAPVAPAAARAPAVRTATQRRSEFEAAMARLSPDQQNRVRVAMALVQVNVSETPDDFAADFLRAEVALHATRGSLDQLLDEMSETPYPAKISIAYATRGGRGS